MNTMTNRLLLLACMTCPAWAGAASLIEQREGEATALMYIEGGKMRIETRGQPDYALMDLKTRSMFLVNPTEKRALDMSAGFRHKAGESAASVEVDARLEKKGAGPEIAGYATEHYVLSANGKKCQDIYASTQAFRDSGWAELWDDFGKAFKEMSTGGQDPCDIADETVVDPAKVGWPLKTVTADGDVMETVRIQNDVAAPAGGFDVPAGYQVISLQQMLQDMLQNGAGASGGSSQ
jgi:hypothetical protein